MSACDIATVGRRRTFWTTQPSACGDVAACGTDCSRAGLALQRTVTNCAEDGTCGQPPCTFPRSFATNDWVRSLAINILMTDARREPSVCGWSPSAINGHWSESYADGNITFGTDIRYNEANASVQDQGLYLQAKAQASLQKLVSYGVAIEVRVTVAYVGRGRYTMAVAIIGQSGTSANVSLSGSPMENAWVWS